MELQATDREGYRERQGGGEEGGRATERRGEECIDRCHSDVSPHAPVSAGVRARGGGRERRINKSWALVSSLRFILSFLFFFFSISINPRNEGGCQLARQNKRKGCFEWCLFLDKGQGRGSGGQHTAGTKTGFLE